METNDEHETSEKDRSEDSEEKSSEDESQISSVSNKFGVLLADA